jgi:hypothetical protein
MVYLTFSLDGGAGGKLTVGLFESAYLSATPNLLDQGGASCVSPTTSPGPLADQRAGSAGVLDDPGRDPGERRGVGQPAAYPQQRQAPGALWCRGLFYYAAAPGGLPRLGPGMAREEKPARRVIGR